MTPTVVGTGNFLSITSALIDRLDNSVRARIRVEKPKELVVHTVNCLDIFS